MKEKNSSDLIFINKAVLTPKAVQCLESLQDEYNFGLHAIRNDIANAVCLLAACIPELDEKYRRDVYRALAALAEARKTLQDLEKPSGIS